MTKEKLTQEMIKWVDNAERTNLLDPTLNFEYEFDLTMKTAERLYDAACELLEEEAFAKHHK
jgi:hypothetical protein